MTSSLLYIFFGSMLLFPVVVGVFQGNFPVVPHGDITMPGSHVVSDFITINLPTFLMGACGVWFLIKANRKTPTSKN